MTLSDKIIQLRKRNGWSQEDLAERMDISRQAISRWENGTALPDANNILHLSKLFNVTTDYLLNDNYSDDKSLPSIKTVSNTNNIRGIFYEKRFLIVSFIWLISAVIWFIQALIWFEVIYCVLAVVCAVLSFIYIILYEKGKKTKS